MPLKDSIRMLGVREKLNGTVAVFAVRIAYGEVFMKVVSTPYLNAERAVVHVDASKFLALWRKDPSGIHREWAGGNETSWRSDRKFPRAIEGFRRGNDDPVPLANVFCETIGPPGQRNFIQRLFDQPIPMFIGFTNGITRTIWLLSNGCTAFPVECETSNAIALCRLAGIPGTEPQTVEELTQL